MRELKVQCDCGQKFKFDVEPVNNQMPFTVNCPVCAKDGTDKANLLLRAQSSASAAPGISLSPPQPVASFTPAAPAMQASAPVAAPSSLTPAVPSASEQPRLRLNAVAHAEPATPPPMSAPVSHGAAPVLPPVAAKTKSNKEFNLTLGIVGAVLGGVVGTVGWYFLIKLTQHEYAIAAYGVGLVTAVGARVLGRGGNTSLGIVTAICALVAMLGGRYLFVTGMLSQAQEAMSGMADSIGDTAYDAKLELGKQALQAQSDDDIKTLYKKMNFSDPSDKELADFKAKDLEELKDIANGKLTKAQFIENLKRETGEVESKIGFNERWMLFKMSFEPISFIIIGLGVLSAYRIGSR